MPPVSRSQCREWALQVLYTAEFSGRAPDEEVRRFWGHFHVGGAVPAYLEELVNGCQAHREEVDALIARYSEHWRLERMAAVDRNLLRLGAYELLHEPDVPAKVVINEAVELAKRFGSEGSGAFINGLLDRIREAIGREA
jgi:N utilization substance protein B